MKGPRKRVVGTPDYLAPEVVREDVAKTTKAVDWWALGRGKW